MTNDALLTEAKEREIRGPIVVQSQPATFGLGDVVYIGRMRYVVVHVMASNNALDVRIELRRVMSDA